MHFAFYIRVVFVIFKKVAASKEMCIVEKMVGLFLILHCILALVSAMQGDCLETYSSTPSCIVTKQLPLNKDGGMNYQAMPSIGNGYIGTVVMSDEIHVSGVFNGKANVNPDSGSESLKQPRGYYNHTHRARIPSPVSVNFTTNLPNESRLYILDMQRAIFVQNVQGSIQGSNYTIQQRSYAHRVHKNIVVTELEIESDIPLDISLTSNMGPKSRDIDFDLFSTTFGSYNVMHGKIRETETETSEKISVAVIYSKIPRSLLMQKTSRHTFITAISTSLETDDTINAALNIYRMALQNKDTLLLSHEEAWDQIWQTSNITIDNNLFLAQTVYSSFYNIISSVRDDWEHGLSPGSLPMGYEYLGHTFWDQDTWMFPPILLFHPNYGKSLLNYRYERLEAAKKIAEKYKFAGAMFPWESALSGFEVCPEEVYGRNEIHITGDIAFAVNQYFQATNDFDWMRTKGFQILYQSALFWQSRVTFHQSSGSYFINDVMPPDEYHYPVNNSVYTNVIAQKNLRLAVKFGKMLNILTPAEWEVIADKMYIPFDKDLQYHPEYDGFDITDPTSVVKQADTILINFPLMYSMTDEVKRNNLKLYGNITDPDGPAMTHSIFSIGWNDIGEIENAHRAFEKNYENIQLPFFVWSEIRGGEGAANFITAAGGYLQSVVFGYGGLRLKDEGLLYNMQKLPSNESYCLNGIKYIGNVLQFCRHGDECVVRKMGQMEKNIGIVISSPKQCHGTITIF